MVRPGSDCDLCGLPLPMTPVVAAVDGAEKGFCCEGCRRVYQVAAANDMLGDVIPASRPRARSLDVALGRGETAYFSLEGMWCSGCAIAAERALGRRPGVLSVDVSFAAERGRLQYDPGSADRQRSWARSAGWGTRRACSRSRGVPANVSRSGCSCTSWSPSSSACR